MCMIANCLTVVNVNTLQRVVKWGETVVGNTIRTRVIAYRDSQHTEHITISRFSFVTYLCKHGWAISWTWWRLLHYKILYHITSAGNSKDSIFTYWHTPYMSVTTICCVVVLSQFIKNNSHQQKSHSSHLLIFCYKVKLWFKALAYFLL